MPSVSKSQQRLMGMAYAVKDGSLELSDIDPAYRDKVKSLSDGMTKKDLKKYASTKHDKLPETVDEAYIGPFVFNDRMSDEELKGMYDAALDGYAYHQKGMQYAKSDYKKAYQEIEKILKKRGVAVDEDFAHAAQNITPSANIGGMGPVVLPSDGTVGSGDKLSGPGIADIDDEEEAKKQKGTVKNLQAEELALTFKAFLNEQNEAMDYNDPVLVRSRVAKMRADDMKKLDALKKKEEKERKKAMKRWNQKKYDKWLEDVASNGGWENAFDMAQNAEHEPGLIDWVKKEFPYDDAYQRIQWDIEAFAESVVTEGKLKISGAAYDLWNEKEVQRKLRGVKIKIIGDIGGVLTVSGSDDELQKVKDILGLNESVVNEKKLDRDDMMAWIGKYMDFVKTTEEFNGSQGGIWVSGENGDEYKGRVIYAYYSEDYKNRTFGVDNRWEKELNKRGWYSEWHDAGTSMIWPL
jgi:hypothetical protein